MVPPHHKAAQTLNCLASWYAVLFSNFKGQPLVLLTGKGGIVIQVGGVSVYCKVPVLFEVKDGVCVCFVFFIFVCDSWNV